MADWRDVDRLEKQLLDFAEHNGKLLMEVTRLEDAIRKHRDERGDDRCWQSDEELYRALPEGYTPPARDSAVELKNCEKYIACRHNPATEYVSPQRRIEQLERYRDEVDRILAGDQLHDSRPLITIAQVRMQELKDQAKKIDELEEALGDLVDQFDAYRSGWMGTTTRWIDRVGLLGDLERANKLLGRDTA
jgi:hypothetical protein